MSVVETVQRGRDAFERGAWREAYASLAASDAAALLGPDELELLATAAYLSGEEAASTDAWERAHLEHIRAGDVPRAVRCAFWLILQLTMRRELAPAGGWLARAQRLLDEGDRDCSERGLLLVLVALGALKAGDAVAAAESFARAAAIGDRFGDAEAMAFGRLGQGQAHAMRGEASQAAALFDEVMVAVTVGRVSPMAVGTVYCAVIEACREIFDLERIRDWTRALARWCGTQPDLVPFRGQCLVHRAEVMWLCGSWPSAMREAEHACRWIVQAAGPRDGDDELSLRGFPIGAAYYQLGDIHRLRGELAEAEEAYRRASRFGRPPEPGLALLRLAQGRPDVAAVAIRRVLHEPRGRVTRVGVLAACVEIMLAVRDVASARPAAEELSTIAAAVGGPYLRALARQASGHVLLAEERPREALALLREAWMGWQELDAPYPAACVRVLMALGCRTLGDDDAAQLELEAARRVFERLGAATDLARVDELLATPSDGRGRCGLTPRELQVMGLVAAGRTNKAIAGELAISERTVDRHVSNILTKLGLPSRSAATAFAYEHGLV